MLIEKESICFKKGLHYQSFKMDRIKIIGGNPLKGIIKISGSKNSALPILAATLLTDKQCTLNNVPRLTDVFTMIKLLKSFNVKIDFKKNTLLSKSDRPQSLVASYDLVRRMRASFLILGPLLARYGYAEVSMPGGCAIGQRPVDLHLDGLEKLGAKFVVKDGYVKGQVNGLLKGTKIRLKKKSVGATENLMMAASLSRGKTIIENASQEPEIEDLGKFLKKMGADVNGCGSEIIEIKGKKKLNGCNYKIMPDRIEAGTFALCVLGCSGDIILKEITPFIANDLKRTFSFLKQIKFKNTKSRSEIKVSKNSDPLNSVMVETEPYPGFPTDLQAQLIAALTISNGVSEIQENIFENRFMHVSELKRMGANLALDKTKVRVKGKKKIYGAEVMATDLRASSCLIIAGLMAQGKTIINRVYHLDRGYENIELKLKNCGALIERIK